MLFHGSLPDTRIAWANGQVIRNSSTRSCYSPQFVDKTLLNAWGIAIRSAGFGRHVWVTSNGNSTTNQYVGDVGEEVLGLDTLHLVKVPGPGGIGTPTGVVFNPGTHFVIEQDHPNGRIVAPAKFIFVGDDGALSAWTERANPDGSVGQPRRAKFLRNRSEVGHAYFGLALGGQDNQLLYSANFGTNPGMIVWNGDFRFISGQFDFDNPFEEEDGVPGLQPGDYAPFNVQTIGSSLPSRRRNPTLMTPMLSSRGKRMPRRLSVAWRNISSTENSYAPGTMAAS